MSTADAWMYGANDGAPRPDEGWTRRARYAFPDLVALLWRERFVMAAIVVAITALGLAYALTLKTTYTAGASIVVRLGQEYVYQPRSGDAGRGAVPDLEDIVAYEEEILLSPELHRRVVDRIGLARLYPDIRGDAPEATAKAVRTMGKALMVQTAAELPSIRLAFEHENPDMAARALNVLLDEYLVRRREILLPSNMSALAAERLRSQGALSSTDDAMHAFLTANDIGDFETEKATLSQTLGQLEQQRAGLVAALPALRQRLGGLTAQLQTVDRETVARDVNPATSAALDAKRRERAEASVRFAEGSDTLARIDAEIADLERALASLPQTVDTARRVTANPQFQTLDTDRRQLEADIRGKEAELAEVNAEIRRVTNRQLELAALEPQFRGLATEQGVLQESVRQLSQREQESLANQAMARMEADNISIVSRAEPPLEGSSKRKIVAALAAMFALFTALCFGLLRVFLQSGLPTAAAAGRTLELPVLATARVRR